MNINLHIEQLIPHGVDMGPAQHQLPQVTSPATQLTNPYGPPEPGRQIAGSVYWRVGK